MMAQEFRYPLTRICLRSGTLTLPLAMLQIFPDDGELAAQDTLSGVEVLLHVEGRQVSGLGDFFEEHALEVNDEVVVKALDDGGLGLTAVKRVRKPDYHRPEVLGRLIDGVVEAGVAMTEGEIRAVHPDLPSGFPLRQALEADERLTLHQGRWHSTMALEEERRSAERAAAERQQAEAARRAEIAAEAERRADAAAKAAEQREVERRAEAAARAAAEREAKRDADRAATSAEASFTAEDDAPDERAEVEHRSRSALAERAEEDVRANARRERDARADARAAEREVAGADDADDGSERFDWDEPVGRGFRFPWQRAKPKAAKSAPAPEPSAPTKDPFRLDRLGEARPSATRPTVVPTPRATLFPSDTALNSASLPPGDQAKTKRAREAFAALGYRVEGLAHGQLMLHADLGRRQHKVLLHVLPDEQRLDWAALLARRRESGATYLAVVGDHRDLHRLTAPADLARATLWSWAGVERVGDLAGTVMLGPVDLEPHFERDGMFEYGIERFERSVAKRVQEKGVVSAVLTRLAGLRAPAVFVIEDLVGDTDVSRDQIVRVLERLSEAPFHLISKVDNGEFCLRYRVHDALDQVAEYATSLRERLPERQRPRVRGFADGETLPGLDPIGADDVDFDRVEASASEAAPEPRVQERRPASRPDARGPASAPSRGPTPARRIAADEGGETAQVPVAVPVAARTEHARAVPEPSTPSPSGGQDALFGGGFGTDFGDDPEDEVDVSQVIDRRPRGRKRR